MLFSADQIKALNEVIRMFGSALLYSLFGKDLVSEKDLTELRNKGLITEEVKPEFIDNAYTLGILQNVLPISEWEKLTPEKMTSLVKDIKLSPQEENTIALIKTRAGTYIQNLADDVKNGLFKTVSEFENVFDQELKVREEIQSVLALSKLRNRTINQMAGDLANHFKNYDRDWLTIVSTELSFARNKAAVDSILSNKSGLGDQGKGSTVIVLPNPDACIHCKNAYLDKNGNPKIWVLEDLLDNGTNFNKTHKESLPVVPPFHPNCQCSLMEIPEDWSFTKEGKLMPNSLLRESVEE